MAENTKEIIKELSNTVKKLEKEKDWAQAAAIWEKIEKLAKDIAWGPAQSQANSSKLECQKKLEAEKAKQEKEQKLKEQKVLKQNQKEESSLKQKSGSEDSKKEKAKPEKEDDKKEKKKTETDSEIDQKMKDWKAEQERKERERKKNVSNARTVDQIMKERNLTSISPIKGVTESKSLKSPEETAEIQENITAKEQQANKFMANRQWTEANELWHEIEKDAQMIGANKTLLNAQKNAKICTENWYADQMGRKK